MIDAWFHPSERRLTRFAEGESTEPDARLIRHLTRCTPCRRRIMFLRELASQAEALAGPLAGPALLARIQDRLARGERVILPLADPPANTGRWNRGVAAAAAAGVAGVALWLLWPAADLTAADTAGTLTFTPSEPHAGQGLTAAYRAPAALVRERRLVLRARYRSPRDGAYNDGMLQTVAAELTGQGGGVFRAILRLPDSVVYAAFAVEDTAGRIVDGNGGRLWELMVHDSASRPTFEALAQRENDLMGRNWEQGYETARRVAALYPERVATWTNLLFYEKSVLGESGLDSTLAVHRARLREFHDRLAPRASLSADDLGYMFWYALGVRDSVLERYWRGRLEREAPASPFAVQNRALAIAAREWKDKDSVGALADLDRLWDEVGPAHGNLINMGWRMARRLGDSAAIVRWAEHSWRLYPRDSTYFATAFTQVPTLREEGMRLLRRELGGLGTRQDARRALERSVEEQRVVDAVEARRLLVALGDALVANGQTAAGLDTLQRAVREGWDVALFRRVARIQLATGDTTAALQLLGLVAADPAVDEWGADSAGRFIGARIDSTKWHDLVRAGRAEMRRRLLDMATRRRVPPDVRLEALDGGLVRFDSLARGRVTVVAFWSRHCGPSLEELPALERLAARLRRAGIGVVTVTDERMTDDLRRFLAGRNFTFPVFADAWREASRAFNQWGTPSYFVLDASGHVRFAYRELGRIPSEVAALQ